MDMTNKNDLEPVFHYEPSRYIDDFHLAGFAYYDGLDVIEELTLGQSVSLVKEINNPYDEKAVAIYDKDKKIRIYSSKP